MNNYLSYGCLNVASILQVQRIFIHFSTINFFGNTRLFILLFTFNETSLKQSYISTVPHEKNVLLNLKIKVLTLRLYTGSLFEGKTILKIFLWCLNDESVSRENNQGYLLVTNFTHALLSDAVQKLNARHLQPDQPAHLNSLIWLCNVAN